MAMEVSPGPRPHLIDRLRLVQLLRKHFGEPDAIKVVDAFQDEFAPMATHDDIGQLKDWIRAEINAAIIKMLVGAGVIAGVALAIARLV